MKNISKILIILLTIVFTNSCQESDNTIDQTLNSVDRTGAYIRTLDDQTPDLIFVNNPDAPFYIEIEANDAQNGELVKEIRVFLQMFNDQNGTDSSTDKILWKTIPASEMMPSEGNNMPSTTISFTAAEAIDIVGNPAGIPLPSYLIVSLELELTDGRVFDANTVGPEVSADGSGCFYCSPFDYLAVFINI